MAEKVDKVPFENALNMTGFGKFNLVMFALCGSMIVGLAFEIFSVSYLVPASVCELGTSSSQQGLIAGVPLIGIITTSHIWGYLADTRGRRKMLCLSMTLGSVSGAAAALSPNWIGLLVLKFMSSSALAGAFALSLTLLSECTPMAKRSNMVTLTTSVFLFSTGIMAVLSIPILPLKFSYYIPYLNIHFNSWRLLDLIFSMPAAFGAVGVSYTYESPKYLLTIGKEKEAVQVLRGIFAMNSGKVGDLYQVNSVVLNEENISATKGFWSSIVAQTLPLLKPPLLKSTLLLSFLIIIVFLSTNPFIVWLPFMVNGFMSSVDRGDLGLKFCQMMRLASNTSSLHEAGDCSMNHSAMTVVFGINIILSLFNIIIGGLIKRFGRKRLFIGIQLISGTVALLINVSTVWIVSAIFFIIYLFAAINYAFLVSFSVDIFPTYVKAMAVCLTLMVGRGSAVIGINVLKSLLETNCEAVFYIFGCVTIAGGLIGVFLPTDAKIAEEKEKMNI